MVGVAATTVSVVRAHSQSSPALTAARPVAAVPYAGHQRRLYFPDLSSDPSPIPTPPPAAEPPPEAAQPPPAAAPPPPPAIAVGSTQQQLINQDRVGAGLGELTWSSCLAGVAQGNALRMANQGFISHTNGPNVDLGCGLGRQAGENVGYWTGGANDGQLNGMFMNSPEHRSNIMGPYHYVATAWVTAANGTGYVAVEFG
jgi:uncharacterized protein YkwD